MIEKYKIHGFVKHAAEDEWVKLKKPISVPTDDHEAIWALLKRAGINYFIYEVRRNKKWVEPSPSQISTGKEPFGTKLGTICDPMTSSSSSEMPSTEGPTDMQLGFDAEIEE